MTYSNYEGIGDYGSVERPRYGHNPGRDAAIAAIILAFFFPLLGLILAIISTGRSRRFGWPEEGLARAAKWISVLFLLLSLGLPFLASHFGWGTGLFNNFHLGPWYF